MPGASFSTNSFRNHVVTGVTPLRYAANTPTPVIRTENGRYYAVDNGVWFTSAGPNGPWAVADNIPADMYSIPASSPVHNVSYVRVYDSTPDYVYVGYTPGYYGTEYRWAATEASSAPATFWFLLPADASRTIDAWWVAGTNRSTAATFIVYDAAGTEVGRVAMNQQTAGSQWNALGTFAFKAGWNRVVLSRWQAAGSVVIADAIRAR